MKKGIWKKAGVIALSAVICASSIIASGTVAAFADESETEKVSYTSGDYTFDKISHPDKPVSTADGIVDYVGNGQVAVDDESNAGDRGQSYSWSAVSYGDWMYVGTCYAAMGNTLTLMDGVLGDKFDKEEMTATLNAMFNGTFFYGQEDGVDSEGILVKVNVKTGETKLIMSAASNSMAPLFRNAIRFKDKLYFCGSVSTFKDGKKQGGLPSVFEIDPQTDEFKCVYQGITQQEYLTAYRQKICTGIRGMAVYGDRLVISCVGLDGAYIMISSNPSGGQNAFTKIATQQDLFDYPAYHYSDSIYGGSIWEIVNYNNDLYVALCTGRQDSDYTVSNQPDEHTMQSFAIVKGHENADGSWTWTSVVGDKEKDHAKYTFGIDPERTRAGACNLVIYNGYLYIGEYEDIEIALEDLMFKKDVQFLAKNLEQSVSLYRMNTNEDIELIVGDATSMFPDGGKSGLGSGFTNKTNQYIWQSKVYDGKLYIGTFDSASLLQPIGQLTNGDLLDMTKDEWISQVNYLMVLIQLLLDKYFPDEGGTNIEDTTEDNTAESAVVESSTNESVEDESNDNSENNVDSVETEQESTSVETKTEAEIEAVNMLSVQDAPASGDAVTDNRAEAYQLVEEAIEAANEQYGSAFFSGDMANSSSGENTCVLTQEQKDQLVEGLLDGSIYAGALSQDAGNEVIALVVALAGLSGEIDQQGSQEFAETYNALYDFWKSIYDRLPQEVKDQIDELLNAMNADNLSAFTTILKYLSTAVRGFDMYVTEDGINFNTITTNGFGDPYNHGLRVFATGDNDSWMAVGTANPFYGTQLWKLNEDTDKPSESESESKESESESQTVESETRETESGGQIVESESQKTESESQTIESETQPAESESKLKESESQTTESQSQSQSETKNANTNKKNVQTGDKTNVMGYMAAMIISFAVVLVLVAYRRKRKDIRH